MSTGELIERIRPEAETRLGFPLEENLVAIVMVGSHSHGTHIPSEDPDSIDDTDLVVIVLPPPSSELGLTRFHHAQFWVEELDVTVYTLRKLCGMLLKSNPNVLCLLWILNDCLLLRTSETWNRLLHCRGLLASKGAYSSFIGYATSQLRKMERHACEGYMGAKRKRLVEKFGYDCKNAAHLVRLLRMGTEFMRTGEMVVDRREAGDDVELRAIKSGSLTLDEVKAEAEGLFGEACVAYESSELRAKPDGEWLEKFLVEETLMAWEAEEPKP